MIRVRIWMDEEYRRVVATGDGPMVVERGETAVLIVGRALDPETLAALRLLASKTPFAEPK